MNKNQGFNWFYFAIGLMLVLAVQSFFSKKGAETVVLRDYNEFLTMLDQNKFVSVEVTPNNDGGADVVATEQITTKDNAGNAVVQEKKYFVAVPSHLKFIEAAASKPGLKLIPNRRSSWLPTLLGWVVPILLFFLLWRWLMGNAMGKMGGGINPLSFGKSRAKLLNENGVKVTFDDVAGVEEAKEELKEVIEFLKNPGKFTKLGGRIPKGCLLVGAPGTGKTLLARAVAGEAGVPFFSLSGADFVEMFIGVGASRVRDLFTQGKQNAPCIIFIDEIDAVGRHRGVRMVGGHDEREQTLNQLLVEMDGFNTNEGVLIVAATNRPDILDPALLRPGRFDRRIVVPLPDMNGREAILKIHTRKVPLEPDIDLSLVARGTPGFAGADLENLVNEAALLAARTNKERVGAKEIDLAKDKVVMGSERKMAMSEEEKRTTAYHEAGHTLVAKMLPGADPVHKVTIIPRGMALGLTQQLPVEEKHTHSQEYLLNQLAILYGGRIAEEIVFGKEKKTTGAENDITQATEIARKMVCEWGMSEKLGPMTFYEKEGENFLGVDFAKRQNYSERTAVAIDAEVKRIITESYENAQKIIRENADLLHRISSELLKKETLDGEEIDTIIAEIRGPVC